MNKFTAPQQSVIDFLATQPEQSAERHVLSLKGLDIRAANNLVKQGVMTCENGVYRLVPPAKFDATVDKDGITAAQYGEVNAATEAREAEVDTFVQPLPEAVLAGVTVEPTKAPKAPRAPKAEIAPHNCLCGCGAILTSKSLFKQGHDAKLHSHIIAAYRANQAFPICVTEAQMAFLKTAHWMKPEILAKLVVGRSQA